MIGTYNNNKTIRVILSEEDAHLSQKNEYIDGRVIVLEESNRNKPMRINLVNSKILFFDCEVHDSYDQQNIFLTKKKLSEALEHGRIELDYIDEYKKNGKIIEILYSGKNEDAKKLLDTVFSRM